MALAVLIFSEGFDINVENLFEKKREMRCHVNRCVHSHVYIQISVHSFMEFLKESDVNLLKIMYVLGLGGFKSTVVYSRAASII